MASISKHGTEHLRADSGWLDVDQSHERNRDVTQRREVYAWCIERYSGKGAHAGKVKVTRLRKEYVRWSPESNMTRYGGPDWHTWGWKVDKQIRMDESKVTSYVDAIRQRVDAAGYRIGR